jgi:hypothetical protein
MRRIYFSVILILVLVPVSHAQFGDIFKRKQPATSGPLTNDKITAGLKEALQVSTTKAVSLVSKRDGFLMNDAIKIPLPEKLRTVSKGFRMVGMGAQFDELEVGMNRAAEQASPKAKAIFIAALKKMTFDDARQIWNGSDTAATEYFRRASSAELTEAFTPIVHDSLSRLGVVRQYNAAMNSVPQGAALTGNFDLDGYVVQETLDGLFYMLGKEEQKIRKDPAAQTTALLRAVFGNR